MRTSERAGAGGAAWHGAGGGEALATPAPMMTSAKTALTCILTLPVRPSRLASRAVTCWTNCLCLCWQAAVVDAAPRYD